VLHFKTIDMKRFFIIFLLLISMTISHNSISQILSKPVFVIVHGAWGGGWAFNKVDSLLTEKGYIVYRPTLTGQGERVHLASTNIGLYTHIKDIVNTILYEDLHNIILVGHSYGGMVVTGVADSLPERLKKLVYVDSFVPENGESARTIRGVLDTSVFKPVNGFIIPPWVPEGQKPPKDVPHPYKTLTDTITLKNDLRLKIPTTFILTVEKGVDPKDDEFAFALERAKKKGWNVLQLEADHNPQWSAPEAFVEMLIEIAKE
jgi:hypothetical protein